MLPQRSDGSGGHFGKLQTICQNLKNCGKAENFKWHPNATLFTNNNLAFICALAYRKQFDTSACKITIIIRVNGYIINTSRLLHGTSHSALPMQS